MQFINILHGILSQLTETLDGLIQWLSKKNGLEIYQDTDGINIQDAWFQPDNLIDSKHRTIQTGKGYNYIGVENIDAFQVAGANSRTYFWYGKITADTLSQRSFFFAHGRQANSDQTTLYIDIFNNNHLTIYTQSITVGSFDLGFVPPEGIHSLCLAIDHTDMKLLKFYLDGVDVTPDFSAKPVDQWILSAQWFDIGTPHTFGNNFKGELFQFSYWDKKLTTQEVSDLVNGTLTPRELDDTFTYYVDESAGLVSYDASGNENHGTIELGGSAESSFHITSNEVPSVQNELGYDKWMSLRDNQTISSYQHVDMSSGIWIIEVDLLHIEDEYTVLHGNRYDNFLGWLFLGITPTVGANALIYEGGNNPNVSGRYLLIVGTDIFVTGDRLTGTVSQNGYDIIIDLYKNGIALAENGIHHHTNGLTPNYSTDPASPSYINHQPRNGFYGRTNVKKNKFDVNGVNIWDVEDSELLYGVDNGSSSLFIPVDQSTLTGSTVYDVLGNELSGNSIGLVRYDGLIKGSSVGNFDGVLYGEITNSHSGFRLQEFELELEFGAFVNISGTEILCAIEQASSNGSGFNANFYGGSDRIAFATAHVSGPTLYYWTVDPLILPQSILKFVRYANRTTHLFINGVDLGVGAIWETYTWYDEDIKYDGTSGSFIGTRDFKDLVFQGELLSIKLKNTINSETVLHYQFSETNGLTSFNIAADRPTGNADMSWILNGSADGTQWGVSDLQYPLNLASGYSKAGYFDGVRYGDLGNQPLIQIQDFELDITIRVKFDASYHTFFSTGNILTAPSIDRNGWVVDITNVNRLRVSLYKGGNNFTVLTHSKILTDGELLNVNLKVYGNFGNIYYTVNGDLDTLSRGSAIVYGVPINTLIGAALQDSLPVVQYNSEIYRVEYYELDSGGTRINELINLDWKNGNEVFVPNIAVDAPSGSDMAWTAGAGAYSLIPADPTNPTLDILGNELQIIGDGINIIPSENTYNRNPMDAPELVEAGILDTEDITYEDITEDISRFYDDHDENNIINQLVYDDVEFKEPIAGSVGYFDNNLIGYIENNIAYSVQNFEISLKMECLDTGAQNNIFGINHNITSVRYGFYFRFDDTGKIGFYAGNALNSGYFGFTSDNVITNDAVREIIIKRINQNWSLEVDGESSPITLWGTIAETDISYDIIYGSTFGSYRLSGNIVGFRSIGERQYNGFYELDSGGTRINELINLNFSEEAGLTWYNIAENRPLSGDCQVILNGSSDGTQFVQLENKDYHHNLKYGKVSAGYFDGVRYGDLGIIPEFQIQDFEANFEFYVGDIYDNAYRRLLTSWRASEIKGFTIGVIRSGFGIGPIVFFTYKDTDTNNISCAGTTLLESNSFNRVQVKKYNGNVKVYLNEVLDYNASGKPDIEYATDEPYEIGAIEGVVNGNKSLFKANLYSLDSSGNRVEQRLNLDWNNGTETSVPNIAADAPSGSDMTWASGSGEYVQIPGDPNNRGLDINGFPIDNPDVVTKYNDISKYLNR